MAERPKVSIYWAAGCGGCEIGFLGINEKIIDVDANFELVFCPCLMDSKKKDLKAMPDKSIAITFFNGAIRTESDEEMALLLRQKSQVMIAFGSCSFHGGIPGLANGCEPQELIQATHLDCITVDNPDRIVPQPCTEVPEGTLYIPELKKRVMPLSSVVPVEYFMPGCPPEAHQIWHVIDLVIQGCTLPPPGSVIGAGNKTVCDECKKTKDDKSVSRFYRTYEIIPEQSKCLLEQGMICMGIATRDGCGGLCPDVNMPCTGCYGPADGILDQGAKMIAALGSILDISALVGLTENEQEKRLSEILEAVPDCAGSFYKYTLANSILKGRVRCSA